MSGGGPTFLLYIGADWGTPGDVTNLIVPRRETCHSFNEYAPLKVLFSEF
jgi:hypothetical protein